MSFRRPFPEISRYTFGTGQVHDPSNPDHVKVVRAAMDAGVWFHTSSAYGGGSVYRVLRAAFQEAPDKIPHIIFKVDGRQADLLREAVDEQLLGTGVDHIDIAQLCGNPDPAGLRPGSELFDAMCDLQQQGKVGSYVLENYWSFSANALEAVREDVMDGYIFYYNVVNREATNKLYLFLEQRQANILALRTLGGGPLNFNDTGDPDGAREALEAIYARSGCSSRSEFRMRFLLSIPNIRTTIGATNKLGHLQAFLETGWTGRSLDEEIVSEIKALHRKWFAEKGLA